MEKKRHQRKDSKPIYREAKREIAVKVYTINQESRHLVVKGIPAISSIEEDVLRLFSPVGDILEYRTLNDHEVEEFTIVYLISYKDIQAARVAKRKLNKRSFFGNFLSVSYAPEFETVEDTRKKLQQRAYSVARRLQQLQIDKKDIEESEPSELDNDESTPASVSLPPQPAPHAGISPQPHSGINYHQPSRSEVPRCSQVEDSRASGYDVFPSLPLPPRHLPPSEWRNSVPDDTPRMRRIPTAHATLPSNFNPYPDDTQRDLHDVDKSIQICGPVLPPATERFKRQYPEASQASVNVTVRPNGLNCDGARPKLVPRRKFAWTDKSKQTSLSESSAVLGSRQAVPPTFRSEQPSSTKQRPINAIPPTSMLPREVARGQKRSSACAYKQAETLAETPPPATGSTSFDETVNLIRQRMSLASEGAHQPGPSRSFNNLPETPLSFHQSSRSIGPSRQLGPSASSSGPPHSAANRIQGGTSYVSSSREHSSRQHSSCEHRTHASASMHQSESDMVSPVGHIVGSGQLSSHVPLPPNASAGTNSHLPNGNNNPPSESNVAGNFEPCAKRRKI